MAKKTSKDAGGGEAAAEGGGKAAEPDKKKIRAVIQPKNAMQWGALMDKMRAEHWRTLRVEIQIREWMLAGKPVSLDVAEKMLKARGLEDQIEALPEDPTLRGEKAEQVIEEGVCEFFRRPGKLGPTGKEGIWFPTNHLKAGFKENWSVMGYRNDIRGSRGAVAEGLFIYAVTPAGAPPEERDWIWLGTAPKGEHTAISHTMSPKGPVHALKRHEYVEQVRFRFDISITKNLLEKIPDENIADVIVHWAEHGMGACRSQGFGKFNILSVEDVELAAPAHPDKAPLAAVK